MKFAQAGEQTQDLLVIIYFLSLYHWAMAAYKFFLILFLQNDTIR